MKKIKNALFLIKDVLMLAPLFILTQISIASAQAIPWDTTLSSIETDMTGTVAKALSVVAIVIAGIGFAHSEDGSWKKTAFKVALGVTVAMGAVAWVNAL